MTTQGYRRKPGLAIPAKNMQFGGGVQGYYKIFSFKLKMANRMLNDSYPTIGIPAGKRTTCMVKTI